MELVAKMETKLARWKGKTCIAEHPTSVKETFESPNIKGMASILNEGQHASGR